MRHLLVVTAALVAAVVSGCTPTPQESRGAVAPAAAPAIQRPRFEITTQERFDASIIPAYRGRHDSVYAYIDAHLPEHVEQLRRWVRQPSVSAQNHGIQEMAALVRDDLRKLGFKEAELVPTSGHPGVWGFYDAGAPRTLAVYMMYDVQPVEPEGWRVNAFDGALVAAADNPRATARSAAGKLTSCQVPTLAIRRSTCMLG